MKQPWIIIGIVAIIGVLVFAAWGTGAFENPYWETENTFGKWQEEIIIEYADGHNESLKVLQFKQSNPLTIYYGGEEITAIGYKIYAVGEGSGYAKIQIDCGSSPGDLCCNKKIGTNYIGANCHYGTNKANLGNQIQLLWAELNLGAYVENHPETYPDGTYTVKFTPSGSVRYRGVMADGTNGPWKTDAGLPPGKSVSITVDRSAAATIVLDWSTEITTS